MKHLILLTWLTTATLEAGNPVITDVFTADPAPLVVGDTVYLYCGQDEAAENEHYKMLRWLCYSSKDLSLVDYGETGAAHRAHPALGARRSQRQ